MSLYFYSFPLPKPSIFDLPPHYQTNRNRKNKPNCILYFRPTTAVIGISIQKPFEPHGSNYRCGDSGEPSAKIFAPEWLHSGRHPTTVLFVHLFEFPSANTELKPEKLPTPLPVRPLPLPEVAATVFNYRSTRWVCVAILCFGTLKIN